MRLNGKLFTFLILIIILGGVACTSNSKVGRTPENDDSKDAPKPSVTNPGRVDYWLQQQEAYADKRVAGIDFYAMDSSNVWTLAIDEDKEIRFTSQNKEMSFKVAAVEGRQPADLNATMYMLNTDKGTCTIRITPDTCINGKDERLPYTVKVFIKNGDGAMQSFEGCGIYLNNPALNDIWALKYASAYSAGNELEKLPVNPYIELNLGTNRVYGNLGCGEIAGYLRAKGNKLRIYGLDYINSDHDCASQTARNLLIGMNYKDLYVSIKQTRMKLVVNSDTLIFQKVD